MSKKRGQGEGSIYWRKDGLWVSALMIRGKRLVKYFKTHRDARDWLQETRNQAHTGLTFAVTQVTVGSFLQEWLSSYETSIRPKTFEQYTQIVNQYLASEFASIKLRDLRPDHIQTFYARKIREGKSPRTVLIIHAVLHRALNQALRWD